MKLKERQFDEFEVKVATVGRGQMIGLSDLIAERFFSTSVKCISSKGSVFEIKAEEFKQKLQKEYKTWNYLLQHAKEADEGTYSHIKTVTKNFGVFKKNDFDKGNEFGETIKPLQ